MHLYTRITAAALCAALAGAAPARADVTAEQVWQGVVDYYAALGQAVTVDGRDMAGDTLVVTGARIGGTDRDATFDLRVPEIRLRETGDGRVEVTAAERITGSVAIRKDAAGAARTRFELMQTGATVMVSGSPDDLVFDYAIPALTAATADPAAAATPLPLAFSVTMKNGAGKARMSGTAMRILDGDATVGTVGFDVTATPPEDGAAPVRLTGTLNDASVLSGVQMPADVDLADMAAALAAGYRQKSRLRFASGNVAADVGQAGDRTNVQAGLADGEISLYTSRDGLAYALRTGASRAVVQSPALPVPAEMAVGAAAAGISAPVTPGAAAQPFSTEFRVSALTLSDGIWAMFDPTAALPRDPMSVALDLSGTIRLAHALFDQDMAGGVGTIPAEVENLSLNAFEASALGAGIAASGTARMVKGGAQPIPVGSAQIEVNGLGGLLDRLVTMGLVPQDQAMGLRMMMAMFTVPGADDSATSRIESDAEGNVRVNGQVLYKFPKG